MKDRPLSSARSETFVLDAGTSWAALARSQAGAVHQGQRYLLHDPTSTTLNTNPDQGERIMSNCSNVPPEGWTEKALRASALAGDPDSAYLASLAGSSGGPGRGPVSVSLVVAAVAVVLAVVCLVLVVVTT